MQVIALPKFTDYFYPTLCVLKHRRGRATIREIEAGVAEVMQLPRQVTTLPHGKSGQTEFQYRLAWVRTCLKKYGAVNNCSRGIWEITETGANISALHASEIYALIYLS